MRGGWVRGLPTRSSLRAFGPGPASPRLCPRGSWRTRASVVWTPWGHQGVAAVCPCAASCSGSQTSAWGGTWTDSWAPSGLPLGRLLAVRSPGWPRAHRDGIHETQAQLSGKSVFNFWSASGSRSQVCSRGGGLQAQQPARRPAPLRGQGPRHPLSQAREVRRASSGLSSGGLCALRPCFPSLLCMGLRRPF